MNSRDSDGISVIIVSYNSGEFLRRCLSSLYGAPSPLVSEVIVVDNASTDGSVEMIESEFPQVTLLKNRRNLGYAAAVNQGIRSAAAPYFLILNPDVETGGGAIKALRDFMEATPKAGLAGGRLLNTDGTLQMSCRTFYTVPVVLLRRTFLGRLFPRSPLVRSHLMLDWDHDSDRRVDWVIGACMMVRREAYENVGGMDERFFLYLEDVDWCYRMKKHGWEVYYVHNGTMTHHYRRESAGPMPGRMLLSHLASALRFYDKWGSAVYALKRERRIVSFLIKVLIDILMLSVAFLLAYRFRAVISPYLTKPLYPIAIYRSFIIFGNVLCLIAFAYSGLYRRTRRGRFARDLVEVSRALFVSWIVMMASTYLTKTIAYSRIVIIAFFPISTLLVTAARAAERAVHENLRRGRFDLHRALIVGADQAAMDMRNRLTSARDGAMDFVGYVVPVGVTPPEAVGPVVGSTARIGDLVVEHRINQVLVADRNLGRDEIGAIVTAARRYGAEVMVASGVTDMLIRGSLLDDIAGIPVIVFPPASLSGPRLLTKRLNDYLWALLGVAGLSLLAPAVLVVRLVRGGGYSALSRAYRLLGAVLAGRRSLVGPLAPVEGESLLPGVTGIRDTAADLPLGVGKDRLDMYYVQNWSLSMDLEIIVSSMRGISGLFGSVRTPRE
jgi:GT2 family glycosyltransferase